MDIQRRLPGAWRGPTSEFLKSKKPATAAQYAFVIRLWLTWCAENDVAPDEAAKPQADRFAADQRTRMKEVTVTQRISILTSWYAALNRHNVHKTNPFAKE